MGSGFFVVVPEFSCDWFDCKLVQIGLHVGWVGILLVGRFGRLKCVFLLSFHSFIFQITPMV